MPISLVTPPAAEPVSIRDLAFQLRLDIPQDNTEPEFVSQLTRAIASARQDCESYCRRAFLTQTWLWQRDRFHNHHCSGSYGYHELLVPNPQLIAVEFFRYIDPTGTQQSLALDTTFGNGPNLPTFGFQVALGGDTQPARLKPRVGSPSWPPTLWIQNAVQIQYKAGYGGPVTAGMSVNSLLLIGAVFLPGEVGRAVTVPGAGPGGAPLATSIASVDQDGVATLASPATTAVSAASVWVGNPVPMPIVQAVLVLAKAYFNEDYESSPNMPLPQFVADRLGPYRNLVS